MLSLIALHIIIYGYCVSKVVSCQSTFLSEAADVLVTTPEVLF